MSSSPILHKICTIMTVYSNALTDYCLNNIMQIRPANKSQADWLPGFPVQIYCNRR